MPEGFRFVEALPALNRFAQAQRNELRNAAMDAVFVGEMKRMEEGKRGEELFHLILSGIREIYDIEAIISGGAVRDLAAGVTTPKDVDVFVPITWNSFNAKASELGWQCPPERIGKTKKARAYDGTMSKVVESEDRAIAVVQHVNVDLVFTKKPLDMEGVATFPVFAQRGVWTLEGGLALSPEARKDIDNKTFTIDPTITDKERVKGLLTKVGEWKKRPHYNDWTIVEPDIKEWWEAKEEMKAAEEETKMTAKEMKDMWNNTWFRVVN